MSEAKSSEPIELDGRTLEGGGQLLRMALCLSALTGTAVKIDNIRGNRSSGGGLKAQHLACVKWLAHACNARVEGAERGSKTLLFTPGSVPGGLSPAYTKKRLASGEPTYEARLDIGTAGSTGLALQAILPFILFSRFPSDTTIPIRLTLTGGTNVSGSPSYDYITQVLLPTLHSIGFPGLEAHLTKRGWSQGGSGIGSFIIDIPARPGRVLPAFTYSPPSLTIQAARRKPRVKPSCITATFIAPKSCHEHFRTVLLPPIHHHFDTTYTTDSNTLIINTEDSNHEKRMYLLLVATIPLSPQTSSSSSSSSNNTQSSYTLGRDWLYARKIHSHERSATEMAERVTKDLADEWMSGGVVDEHMRDQLVIFQALAEGRSQVYAGRELEGETEAREPSLHARTAEWVAKRMLGVRFDVEGVCEGVGFGGGDEDVDVEEGDAEAVDERNAEDLIDDVDVG